jgi:putative pyruvate formate lyase activating enzyme
VNRTQKEKGFCKAAGSSEVYRFAPHYGEEPPLSGSKGSGTVFFSRCTMKCIYCQNYPWSQESAGETIGVAGLIRAFQHLKNSGCHNINLVSPTPWIPDICEALLYMQGQHQKPIVIYNTSGFERIETIELLNGMVDIFLPDLRYASEESAFNFSKVKGYVAFARKAIHKMYEQTGELVLDENGIAKKGVICRILVLPSMADEAKESLKFLAEEIGEGIGISLMAQYTPAYKASSTPPINRRITAGEYYNVMEFLQTLNFKYSWIQECDPCIAEEFLGFKMKSSFDMNEPVTNNN